MTSPHVHFPKVCHFVDTMIPLRFGCLIEVPRGVAPYTPLGYIPYHDMTLVNIQTASSKLNVSQVQLISSDDHSAVAAVAFLTTDEFYKSLLIITHNFTTGVTTMENISIISGMRLIPHDKVKFTIKTRQDRESVFHFDFFGVFVDASKDYLVHIAHGLTETSYEIPNPNFNARVQNFQVGYDPVGSQWIARFSWDQGYVTTCTDFPTFTCSSNLTSSVPISHIYVAMTSDLSRNCNFSAISDGNFVAQCQGLQQASESRELGSILSFQIENSPVLTYDLASSTFAFANETDLIVVMSHFDEVSKAASGVRFESASFPRPEAFPNTLRPTRIDMDWSIVRVINCGRAESIVNATRCTILFTSETKLSPEWKIDLNISGQWDYVETFVPPNGTLCALFLLSIFF